MKRWKRNLLILFIIGLVTAGIILYIATKKPAKGIDGKPVKVFNASELIMSLDSNSTSTSKKYMFKNIGIIGKIKEVDISRSNIIIDAGSSATVNCSFDSLAFVNSKSFLKIGEVINVKGIYDGCDGFDKKNTDDDLDLIPTEKTAMLRTCGLNNQ